ncbi:hypothetical protein [Arthrobacter sp. Z1-15]
MSVPGAGPRRSSVQVRRLLLPGAVWAAILFAAPFLNDDGGEALLWGAGAAVLVSLFPWALVTILDRRGDLRRGLDRLGAPPVILGAAGACFMVLRVIRWTDGPRALAAVVFAMITAYALTSVFAKVIRLDWADVTYAASAVVLPVLLFLLFSGAAGIAAALAAAALFIAALLSGKARTARNTAGAAAAGVVSAGIFVWLLQYSV